MEAAALLQDDVHLRQAISCPLPSAAWPADTATTSAAANVPTAAARSAPQCTDAPHRRQQQPLHPLPGNVTWLGAPRAVAVGHTVHCSCCCSFRGPGSSLQGRMRTSSTIGVVLRARQQLPPRRGHLSSAVTVRLPGIICLAAAGKQAAVYPLLSLPPFHEYSPTHAQHCTTQAEDKSGHASRKLLYVLPRSCPNLGCQLPDDLRWLLPQEP